MRGRGTEQERPVLAGPGFVNTHVWRQDPTAYGGGFVVERFCAP